MLTVALSVVVITLLPLAVYAVFLGIGSIPFFQRHFIYAHKINSLLFDDLNTPEAWGFVHNQATPFNITTADGETLYAWHVLPLSVYSQNESVIAGETRESRRDITQTNAFRLLKQDPNRKVNAGHLANGGRTESYHALTYSSDYHVIAFDYRGFGLSTGSPSETGLVIDACSVINWVITVAEVPPENIVLFGHSLGTAVVSAALEKYSTAGTLFAGTLLVAPFSQLPEMLTGYRILGIFPVLGPLYYIPGAQRLIQSLIWESWRSVKRLSNVVRVGPSGLRLTLIHAMDDRDIPAIESGRILFHLATALESGVSDPTALMEKINENTVGTVEDGLVTTWVGEPNLVIRRILCPYGGHNNVIKSASVVLEIHRFFNDDGSGRLSPV
ncbi:hypothetical protein TD95_000431 [Thielaviopsis punctulata]|uniref:AB hydrolase-1 domain-containing protein n=1 Tax=Thielaviopsis punctulata TaxID=72032 RepID=A0A0F4ZIB2_9PEZI|nr:hypothetical protein TD95_000431 [Thielaviopsis punctulata]